MTTIQEQKQHQQYEPQLNLDAATYDPDEVVPHDTPLMKALHPKLELSPSPPPDIPSSQVSFSSPPTDGCAQSNRQKILPNSGVAVLVAYLDNGRRPEIAQAASIRALPGADDDIDESGSDDGASLCDISRSNNRHIGLGNRSCLGPHNPTRTFPSALQHLAADALQAVAAEPLRALISLPYQLSHDISVSTRQLSIHDERSPNLDHRFREASLPDSHLKKVDGRNKSSSMPTPSSGELPPMQIDPPRPSESNIGQNLPSIRSTLGDINRLPAEHSAPVDRELSARCGGPTQNFPRSPSIGIPRLPPMSTSSHASPPISPNETYQRSLPSPHSLPASSPHYYSINGIKHRPSNEYPSSASGGDPGDTPNTDIATYTSSTLISVADRMSIDGITNSQIGVYVCTFGGCTAPPFQTQYLLNSHANVHSLARPHYCPVQGCPRSEGGKGFKRKNEMIRHGLVHDSPGYVCPFCADREHKYPRPDNLQRCVCYLYLQRA